jgi:hypothetical protein
MSIKIILSGGIGNQLFQYAFGRSLSIKNNMKLILETGSFEFDLIYNRKNCLKYFNINKNIIFSKNIVIAKIAWKLVKFSNSCSILNNFIYFIFSIIFISERDINQYHHSLDKNLLKKFSCKIPKIFCGYWQHYGYFNDIRNLLINEFQIKKLSQKNQILKNIIENNNNSVMVHIRLNHEKPTSVPHNFNNENDFINENILPTNYYIDAIEILKKTLESPTFFVFSDNPKNLRKHEAVFSNFEVFYLDNKRGEDYEDIYLMSKCCHHIISNSSFSWWGAWLNNNNNQIVIAPKKAKYLPSIPSHWITI